MFIEYLCSSFAFTLVCIATVCTVLWVLVAMYQCYILEAHAGDADGNTPSFVIATLAIVGTTILCSLSILLYASFSLLRR